MCPTHGHGRCSGAPKPEPPSGEKGTNGWSTKTRSTTTNHSVGSKFNRRMLLHDVDNRTIASQVRTPRNRKMLSAPNVAYLHSLSLCVAVCGGYGHTDAAVLHAFRELHAASPVDSLYCTFLIRSLDRRCGRSFTPHEEQIKFE